MIVVDTNITAYLLIDGVRTDQARAVYERDGDWVVPALWEHEFLNLLATVGKVEKQDLKTYRKLLHLGLELFRGRMVDADRDESLRLAIQRGLSAYDSQFVQLAIQQETWLVTEDRKIIKAAPDVACSMKDFLSGIPRA